MSLQNLAVSRDQRRTFANTQQLGDGWADGDRRSDKTAFGVLYNARKHGIGDI
jgi:hypothetical protein